ncbi:MAG TPA: hypothetical protein VFM18_14830, partial [Methanosarcina sp.]|nr:hypothetical protein [Methanosarcina sp.]
TQSTTYNSKGENIGGSASYNDGAKRTHTDGDSEGWAKLKAAFSGGESFREGGGIMFTSASGQGGGPKSRYMDGKIENIDALVSALSIAGAALGQSQVRGSDLLGKLEYIKDQINNYSALQEAGYQPFYIDLEKMKAGYNQCLSCERPYHGVPALIRSANGKYDTLKPNASGGIDTVPPVKQPKRN